MQRFEFDPLRCLQSLSKAGQLLPERIGGHRPLKASFVYEMKERVDLKANGIMSFKLCLDKSCSRSSERVEYCLSAANFKPLDHLLNEFRAKAWGKPEPTVHAVCQAVQKCRSAHVYVFI